LLGILPSRVYVGVVPNRESGLIPGLA